MALDSQQHVDISIVVRKQVLMLELCLINLNFCYQVLHNILHLLYRRFTILPVFPYWKEIYYVLQTMTMMNISV